MAPAAPGTLTVGLREQEDLGCSAMEADRAWLPQFSWAAEDVAAVPSTCTGLGYGGIGDLAGHEAACSQPLP